MHAAYVLLATTGMRRGEVLGLRWSDVDLDAGSLSVEQTLTAPNRQLILGPPKTAKSRRRIALDPRSIDALRRHKRRQNEERLQLGELWSNDADLVFCREDGSLVHPDRFTREFKRQVEAAGLPELRGPARATPHLGDAGAAVRHSPQGRVGPPRPLHDPHHARHVQPCCPGSRR